MESISYLCLELACATKTNPSPRKFNYCLIFDLFADSQVIANGKEKLKVDLFLLSMKRSTLDTLERIEEKINIFGKNCSIKKQFESNNFSVHRLFMLQESACHATAVTLSYLSIIMLHASMFSDGAS